MDSTLLTPAAFDTTRSGPKSGSQSPKTRRRLFKVKGRASDPKTSTTGSEPDLKAEPVVKRGRGRPRKIRTPEELEKIEQENIAKKHRAMIRELRREQRAVELEKEQQEKEARKQAREKKSQLKAINTEKHRESVLEKRKAVLARLKAEAAAAMEKFKAKQAAVEAYMEKFPLVGESVDLL